MERKISWRTGCFDEIELVYEKAEKDESIAELLSEMETMALTEAKNNYRVPAFYSAPAMNRFLNDMDMEGVICHLADLGLLEFIPSTEEPVITVTFSEAIQEVLGCTMFSLLNRLEKLDGAYNKVLFPKAILKLQVPLGCRRGLMKCGMLIMKLYPWLSVSESAFNAGAGRH